MKQKKLLCAVGLSAFLFAGCAQQQSQMGYIGADSAKQAALEAASVSERDVSSIQTDMGTRDGLDYYEVCFETAGRNYKYDVDALTGVVISAEDSAGASGDQIGLDVTTDSQETGAPDSAAGSFSQSFGAIEPTTLDSDAAAYIGEEEARRIALEHAGLEEGQVTFVSSLLEFDDGQWEYDVEFFTANYEEYDYEIDAYTGVVISFDYDAEYNLPQPGGSGVITAEQAQQLALAQVPGADESHIQKFKTDDDDGIPQYEGKIIYNGMKYEFEIDAYSGSIREWSAEPFAR